MSAGSFGNTGKSKKVTVEAEERAEAGTDAFNFYFTNVKNML